MMKIDLIHVATCMLKYAAILSAALLLGGCATPEYYILPDDPPFVVAPESALAPEPMAETAPATNAASAPVPAWAFVPSGYVGVTPAPKPVAAPSVAPAASTPPEVAPESTPQKSPNKNPKAAKSSRPKKKK